MSPCWRVFRCSTWMLWPISTIQHVSQWFHNVLYFVLIVPECSWMFFDIDQSDQRWWSSEVTMDSYRLLMTLDSECFGHIGTVVLGCLVWWAEVMPSRTSGDSKFPCWGQSTWASTGQMLPAAQIFTCLHRLCHDQSQCLTACMRFCSILTLWFWIQNLVCNSNLSTLSPYINHCHWLSLEIIINHSDQVWSNCIKSR